MALPLDNTLREGQSGMLAFLETLATTLNGLAAAADGDVATWDAATSSLTPVTRAALATALGVQTAEELAASPEMIDAFAPLAGQPPSPFGALRNVLDGGADSVAVLVQGDSTGNDPTDWVQETFAAFAADYPAYSVLHRLWDDTNQAYGMPTVLQQGSDGDAYIGTTSSGNYVSTPDAAALDITGDIDIVAKVRLTDWTPAASMTIVSKFGAAGQRSYQMYVHTSGLLVMEWSPDGTTTIGIGSSTAPTVTNDTDLWVRATLDVDNGGGSYELKFYTAPDSGGAPGSWTQLGTTLTGTATSIFAGTAQMELGGRANGATQPLAGRIYYAEVRNGIDGPAVASFDASEFSVGDLIDSAGRTWTFNGTIAVTGARSLLVLNASTSGQVVTYSSDATRFAKQAPKAPVLAFINYGHNDSVNPALATNYAALITKIRTVYPSAPIVATLQNPQASPRTAVQVAAQRKAMEVTVPGLAAANRLPVLDAYTPISADLASYLSADGVHPTAAGQDVWAAAALALLRTA